MSVAFKHLSHDPVTIIWKHFLKKQKKIASLVLGFAFTLSDTYILFETLICVEYIFFLVIFLRLLSINWRDEIIIRWNQR